MIWLLQNRSKRWSLFLWVIRGTSFLPSFLQEIPTWNVPVSYTDNIDFLSFPLGSVNPALFFKIFGEWNMRSLSELDIIKVRCSVASFQRCLPVGWDWHSFGHRRRKCRTAASPKLFQFREAGTQLTPVIMSCPPWQLLHPVYQCI
jgi:hypothetical protein